MNKSIAVIRGDGIGPEIVGEAIRVLDAVAAKFGHTFTYHEAPMGGNAIDAFGVPLPDSSLETCLSCDACCWAPWAGPKWDAQRLQTVRSADWLRLPQQPWACTPISGPPGCSRTSPRPAAAQRYCRPGY